MENIFFQINEFLDVFLIFCVRILLVRDGFVPNKEWPAART